MLDDGFFRRSGELFAGRRDVFFTGRVSDDELVAWYRGARCLVLPSRAEGFGLPPVEAVACGCPVAARVGALFETCGDAALLVEPDDAADLAPAQLPS